MSANANLTPQEKQSRYRAGAYAARGCGRCRSGFQTHAPRGSPVNAGEQARLAARSAQEKPALNFIAEIVAWDPA